VLRGCVFVRIGSPLTRNSHNALIRRLAVSRRTPIKRASSSCVGGLSRKAASTQSVCQRSGPSSVSRPDFTAFVTSNIVKLSPPCVMVSGIQENHRRVPVDYPYRNHLMI
jgi:hypothetical protein